MKRKVAAWLGALAVAGNVAAGAAVYVPSLDAEWQELQSCSNALGIQEPSLSFWEASLYRAKKLVDPKGAEREMRDRNISAIVDKIKETGPNDTSKIDGLVTCIKEGKSYDVSQAATVALRRIGTPFARNSLYSMIASGDISEYGNQVAEIAGHELGKIDPRAAALAIIKRKGRPERDNRSHFGKSGALMGVEFYDKLTSVLIRTGDVAALNYFIQNKMTDELVSFVNRNDSQLLRTYRSRILQAINNRIYRSGSLVCMGEDALLNYGNAIRKLDRYYAEVAANEFKSQSRFCHYAWRGTFPERIFLDALRGK